MSSRVYGRLIHSPWLGHPTLETLGILAPPFLTLIIISVLPNQYKNSTVMPLGAWVGLVLLVDVSHVYSTLFRTYFNRERFKKQRRLYILIPIVCYFVGVILYSTGNTIFWRVLAYVAVYHFVRQQYGFMRLYSRTEALPLWMRQLDALIIYAASIYPILYWHFSPARNFNWFTPNDFVQKDLPILRKLIGVLYVLAIIAYVFKEYCLVQLKGNFNIPRNAIVVGTAISWYFGIVYFNGDVAFTALNVISHGIPYMVLIWLTSKREAMTNSGLGPRLLRQHGIAIFLGVILLAAWLEEGLWYRWVWHEHQPVFKIFDLLPDVGGSRIWIWLIPLLSLPQSTHYVLDGFVWRKKDG